jgi:hypothetical protein
MMKLMGEVRRLRCFDGPKTSSHCSTERRQRWFVDRPKEPELRTLFLTMLVPVTAIISAGAASAHMPADAFLKKADALRARGPIALLSPDLKRLQAAAENAGDELHKEHAAELAAGGRKDYCSPASTYLRPRELLQGLHAIPATKLEHMDIKQAMRAIFERNYPCPVSTAQR